MVAPRIVCSNSPTLRGEVRMTQVCAPSPLIMLSASTVFQMQLESQMNLIGLKADCA